MKSKKLSQSHASKNYFEKKGLKSQPISTGIQNQLREASDSANQKIINNNGVYNSSNQRSHLYPTMEESQSKNPVKMLKK